MKRVLLSGGNMRLSYSCVLFISLFVSSLGLSDPIGESAFYRIVKDRARTSNLIKSGEFNAEVVRHIPDREEGPAYEVKMDYVFDVMWMGRREGSETVVVDEFYFAPEFIEELRRTGHYENSDMKIDHQGYESFTNSDGRHYQNADVLKLYDIDTKSKKTLILYARHIIKKVAIAKAILEGRDVKANGEVENLEVVIRRVDDIEVLGAARIDISGDYQGMHIIAGGDYTDR